ncbi:hypothetical protein QGM71_02880 [Virgibacillus sp. C22-A2]|uniref:Uncharacterized protein n=1 Tax=Virgibacillus tibetensis TaxID=3042313 RepID=A0ABU6KB80_9BACI|nr:hypothetical protein [Virgibacillus sp. C22-A2]
MSQKATERDDQAEELRKLLSEVQQGEKGRPSQQANLDDEVVYEREIDILELPPRKEVHGTKKKRTQIKLSRPLLRFLIVIILLLLVLTGVYYLWADEIITILSN